jgi:hypothetical protein
MNLDKLKKLKSILDPEGVQKEEQKQTSDRMVKFLDVVKGDKGDKGDVGPQGPEGPQGEAITGPQGEPGTDADENAIAEKVIPIVLEQIPTYEFELDVV